MEEIKTSKKCLNVFPSMPHPQGSPLSFLSIVIIGIYKLEFILLYILTIIGIY